MKIIAELAIIPVGVGISFAKYIAECEKLLKNKGLIIQLHAEGTNIEGELHEVLDAVQSCIELVHKIGSPRLVTTVKINSRIDKEENMLEKTKSVEALMEQKKSV